MRADESEYDEDGHDAAPQHGRHEQHQRRSERERRNRIDRQQRCQGGRLDHDGQPPRERRGFVASRLVDHASDGTAHLDQDGDGNQGQPCDQYRRDQTPALQRQVGRRPRIENFGHARPFVLLPRVEG